MDFLVVFSAVSFVVSAWMFVRAAADVRKYFPLQFSDELSSRYYMRNVQFNRSIPLKIRRRIGVSSALVFVSLAGFAAVAYLGDNLAVTLMLLLVCGFGIANVVSQWRSARR